MANDLIAAKDAISAATDVNRSLKALCGLLLADESQRDIGELIDLIHVSLARHLADAQSALSRLEKEDA